MFIWAFVPSLVDDLSYRTSGMLIAIVVLVRPCIIVCIVSITTGVRLCDHCDEVKTVSFLKDSLQPRYHTRRWLVYYAWLEIGFIFLG